MIFLVTGASGMIGSRLVECLVQRYGKDSVVALSSPFASRKEEWRRHKIASLGVRQIIIDLLNPAGFRDELPEFDVIFHLAANLRTDLRDGRENAPIRVNDLGTRYFLESISDGLRGKLFVYTSSIAAVDYDRPRRERLTEESLCTPRTLYGRTKLEGERIVKKMSGKFGFTYVIYRLPTVYGPSYREGSMFELFRDWVMAGALPARIPWPGKISLAYVDDVVDILMDTVNLPEAENDTFFISNPEDVTVGELVQAIAETLGQRLEFLSVPDAVFALLRKLVWEGWLWRLMPRRLAVMAWRMTLILDNGAYCDSSKLDRIYPRQYVDMREGVRRTYLGDSAAEGRRAHYAR